MIDLKDVSIIIPIRIDHEDRLKNLKTVLKYFKTFFTNVDIIIIENSSEQKCMFLEQEEVTYIYQYNTELLYRTEMLNQGFKLSKRKYVSSYDTDVLFEPCAIDETIRMLETGSNFVFPYNGVFIDVSNDLKLNVMETLNLNILPKYENNVTLYTSEKDIYVLHNKSVGGAVFFNKELLLSNGGYNKKFISWGYEDDELVTRFQKLNIKIERIGGKNCLYHLNHFRGVDSSTNHPKANNNKQELAKVANMNINILKEYIKKELL